MFACLMTLPAGIADVLQLRFVLALLALDGLLLRPYEGGVVTHDFG